LRAEGGGNTQTEALIIVGATGGSNTIAGGVGNDTISGAAGFVD
jgi:hypothetical protein